MHWETLYGPNPVCPFYGVRFRESRLVKNGTTRGQRQALCRACRSSVALTYGTPYFDVEHDPALFELAIRALAEGRAIRATVRLHHHRAHQAPSPPWPPGHQLHLPFEPTAHAQRLEQALGPEHLLIRFRTSWEYPTEEQVG
jgi:hypothetical protein